MLEGSYYWEGDIHVEAVVAIALAVVAVDVVVECPPKYFGGWAWDMGTHRACSVSELEISIKRADGPVFQGDRRTT